MDLSLSPEQVALADGVRAFCTDRFAMAEVRRLAAVGGVDRARWSELAALGVFAVRAPEATGGVGLGMCEAAIVFEQLGRALVPGPLVATELATAAGLVGPDVVVVGFVERTSSPLLVEYFDALDRLLVLDDAGVWAVGPAVVQASPVERPLDPLAPVHRATALPAGEPVGSTTDAARLRLEGALLTAAYLAGSAAAVTDLAVAYSLQREQFGRPVGSFQALKHLMADMHVRATVAQSAVYAAAATFDDGTDPARAVHTAKLAAGEAAMRNAKTAVQVHGGMGYTWEVDAHLHLKRAWSLDRVFGSADYHAERISRLV